MPVLSLALICGCIPLLCQAMEADYSWDEDELTAQARPYDSIDSLEGFNRGMHEFNTVVDGVLLDPLAETYHYVFPRFVRNRVFNFLENIESPVVFANSVLQADSQNSFVTFWRFFFNSTLGVAGLFDIATEFGVPQRNNEDFGQTLGVWGVGHGSYLVLPIMGPSSLRDTTGRVVDVIINPFTHWLKPWQSVAVNAARAIDTRDRLDPYIERIYRTSLDPYATFRTLYLQRRNAVLANQRPAQDSY